MKLFGIKRLPENFWFELRNNRSLTFILVREGEIYSTTDRKLKDFITKNYKDGDILLLAWTGEYKTDVFLVTKEELYKHYVKDGKKTIDDYIGGYCSGFESDDIIDIQIEKSQIKMIILLKETEKERCYKCNLALSSGDIVFLVNIKGDTKTSCMWCQEDYRERIKEWERESVFALHSPNHGTSGTISGQISTDQRKISTDLIMTTIAMNILACYPLVWLLRAARPAD